MDKKNSIYEEHVEREKKRKIARIKEEGEKAKKILSEPLKKNSPESNFARGGRQFVRGAAGHLKVRSGRGITGLIRLRQAPVTEWSDMGLIFGSPFKDYKSRNVFPSSLRDRRLHPQEKAEIDAALQKIRLFGAPPLQFTDIRKKKQNDEV